MALSADICGALDFSHRNGIVHRDVKPGNVMITPQGTVKVMDFGIARAVSDSAATMTSTAAVIGTAQYLSPEQARGEGVDARSDVYSMGCMLFELVTGAPPFTGDSPVAVAYQHVREDPRLPSSINPEIPPELDAIVLKAMSKNPANRYQSAAEMRNDLLRALAGQRVEATPVMGDAEKTTILAATPGGPAGYGGYADDDWADDEAARKRKRRIIAIVAAVVALLVAGAIALAFALGNGDDEVAAPTQVEVPAVVGRTVPEATQLIEDAGLTVGTVTTQASAADQEGRVLTATPAPGALADPDTAVDLVVGGGVDAVAIPGVVGLDVEQAERNLESAGFTRVTIDRVDSSRPEGQVISVDPEEGSEVPVETAVTLEVSDGDVAVPEVAGQDEAAATQALRDAGFTNVRTEEVDAPEPAGQVLGTSPGAGTQASADTQITLRVSRGPAEPETAPVPNVRGQSEATARQLLAQVGFTNVSVVVSDEVDPDVMANQVQATDPPAGSEQAPDTEITLILNPPA
jgi:eukaryotic-like serine/threonine-protein kinase